MENQENRVFPALNGKKHKVFELKFEGETYKKIAEETGYSEHYLKKCFKHEGKWRQHYDYWEEQRLEDIEQDGRKRIKKRIAESLTVQETLLTLVGTNPREAGKAARDLLDRAGLKAPEKIEITDPDDKAEKVMKAMERRKAQKQQTKTNE